MFYNLPLFLLNLLLSLSPSLYKYPVILLRKLLISSVFQWLLGGSIYSGFYCDEHNSTQINTHTQRLEREMCISKIVVQSQLRQTMIHSLDSDMKNNLPSSSSSPLFTRLNNYLFQLFSIIIIFSFTTKQMMPFLCLCLCHQFTSQVQHIIISRVPSQDFLFLHFFGSPKVQKVAITKPS